MQLTSICRCYRRQLNDSIAEEIFILSCSESYQEERIWLTEHSDQDLLEDNEILQESYADHYQRYRFYHINERICGDEDDFFLLNNMMKRRRQEELEMDFIQLPTAKQGYSALQDWQTISVGDKNQDEYFRFKDMMKRRQQDEP